MRDLSKGTRHLQKLNEFYVNIAENKPSPWEEQDKPIGKFLEQSYKAFVVDSAARDRTGIVVKKLKRINDVLEKKIISDTGLLTQ